MPIRISTQSARSRAVAAILLTLAAASGAAALQGPAGDRPPSAIRSDLETLLWPAADTVRRDQGGTVLAPARLADRLVVVSFVTPDCAIGCVIRTRDLAAVARSLPGTLRSRAVFLVLGLEPARDGGAALRRFAGDLGLDSAQVSVLDTDAATAARQRAALRYPADRTEPPDTVLVFDRTGAVATNYGGAPLDRERLARDLGELDRFTQGAGHAPAPAAAPSL